jgi:hypothetical protein
VGACWLAYGLISSIFCLLMIPFFSVWSAQIIFAIYGAHSYVEAVSSLKTNLAKLELISVGWASWDSGLWGYVLALEVSWSFVEGIL